MTAKTCVDWLAYTLSSASDATPENFEVRARNATFINTDDARPATARNGYWFAISVPGCTIEAGPARMGTHVSISGSGLRRWDWIECVRDCKARGGKVTRIDLAIDVDNEHFFSPFDAYHAMENGEAKSAAMGATMMYSLSGGATCYIGNRTSERFVRVYDKGAEQGEEPGMLTRVEVEFKGAQARRIFAALAASSPAPIGGLIRSAIDFPTMSQFAIACGEAVDIETDPRRRGRDTERWLGKVAVPSLERALKDALVEREIADQWLLRLAEGYAKGYNGRKSVD